MPDGTTREIVVTNYVYNRFGGTSYNTYQWNGGTVYTFTNAPRERWFDIDNDGFFDYGTRDEGYGHWSTFHGFVWEGDHTPRPRVIGSPVGEEVSPESFITMPNIKFENEPEIGIESTSYQLGPPSVQADTDPSYTSVEVQQDGWIL